MSSGLDWVSEGFFKKSGLSLTTHGLVLLDEEGLVVQGGPLDATLDALLFFDPDTFSGDIRIKNGDLERETTLRTAILLSLFSDRRVTVEELARFGGDDPRGWCLDELAPIAGDKIGSKLWLLAREKVVPETLNRARTYAREALQHFIDDGVAERVDIEAAWLDELDPRAPRGFLALGLDVVKPQNLSARFALVWAGVGV